MSKSIINCPKCGTENVNNDYCSNCGVILNVVLQRKLHREEKNRARLAKQDNKKPSRLGVFLEKGRNHSNFIVRSFFNVGYALWFIIAAVVGIFIAVLAGAVAS